MSDAEMMELATKEIRGINIKIVIAWLGGVITFVILGTLWYAGINNAIEENKKTMDEVQQAMKDQSKIREMQLKELNNKLDAQQLQLQQLKWQWENFQDFYDIKIIKDGHK